jgi:purine nucleoside phosphorylase
LTRITKVEQSNNWHVPRRAFDIGGRPALFDCQSMLAIIGGSGLTRLSTLAVAHREVVRTPYGEPSSALLYGQIAGRDVIFLARHGHGHTIPPHRVNYRANLWALKELGASSILAVASFGGFAPA